MTTLPAPTPDLTESRAALWQIVRMSTRGILGTIGAEGLPHMTNIHFIADPTEPVVRFTTTTTRAKGRNLMRDPRATLHVQGSDWFSFAAVSGSVSILVAQDAGDPATEELYELITTLRGPAERAAFDQEMVSNQRMMVRLQIDRIYGLVHRGGSRGQ